MKKIFYLLLLVLVQSHCFAQDIVIGGETGNRPLTWNDFTGKPDKESSHDANTYWNIDYSFKGFQYKADTAVFTGLTVKLEFNSKQSWIKKDRQTDALLKHEQGHFNIGILCAKELQQTFTSTVFFKKDVQVKINALFGDIMKKYHEMGLQYDKETDHSKNKDEQRRWDELLQGKLAVK